MRRATAAQQSSALRLQHTSCLISVQVRLEFAVAVVVVVGRGKGHQLLHLGAELLVLQLPRPVRVKHLQRARVIPRKQRRGASSSPATDARLVASEQSSAYSPSPDPSVSTVCREPSPPPLRLTKHRAGESNRRYERLKLRAPKFLRMRKQLYIPRELRHKRIGGKLNDLQDGRFFCASFFLMLASAAGPQRGW